MIMHLPMLWVEETPYDPNNFIPYDDEENELDEYKFIMQMRDLGYETHNSILNLGSLFILIMVYFMRLVSLIFIFFIKLITGKCRKNFEEQRKKVFFYDLLLILVEGYMELFISGYLNFQKPLFNSGYLGEKISILVSWFNMIGVLFIAPLALCFIID